MHLLLIHKQGYNNIMGYQITVELRLLECYQAMPVEAFSEEDWLILTFTKITAFRLVI